MTRPTYYILDGREAKPVDDCMEWARWFATGARCVALTPLPDGGEVSTVFLGLDHAFGSRAPEIFETARFSASESTSSCDILQRYSTWAEAEVGHMEWVEHLMPQQGEGSHESGTRTH